MMCKCIVTGRGNGCSQNIWTLVMFLEIIFTTSLVLVASESINPPQDAVAEEFAPLPQFSFPHHRHTNPNFRRQLSQHEQREILTDLQQNHRFNQQNLGGQPQFPNNRQQQFQPNLLSQQQFLQQQHFLPTQDSFFNQQQQISNQQRARQQQPTFPTQQSPNRIISPQSPLSTQPSPILLSLQQSPLSSPPFSNLFTQPIQNPFSNQNSQLPPSQVSFQNPQQSFPQQPQAPILTQPRNNIPLQQNPLTTQQSANIFSEPPVSPFSTQQSALSTQQSTNNEQSSLHSTVGTTSEEVNTDVKVLKGVPNTEFTVEKSISDPEELQKVQELELKREKERREHLIKLQKEQIKFIEETHERRLKERLEEERRDEDRRRKFQEELRRIEEEKAKRLKEQEEERKRIIEEEKQKQLKLQEEERLRKLKEESEKLQKIEEDKKKKEEEERSIEIQEDDDEEVNPGIIYSHSTQDPNLSSIQSVIEAQNRKQQRSRQRARVIEEPTAPEGLLLQSERQKLFHQLKEAQQQQNKQAKNEKQQTQESQQFTSQRPTNQVTLKNQDQRRNQHSKVSQSEKEIEQKKLQEQLQKQFQLQLLQRQDLLRQLKLAVSNAATPTNEDQIAPGPIAISSGNSSGPLFLANGQKLQVVQSPRQGRPVDLVPRNRALSTTPIVSTTTQRPQRALFEDISKGVLPPGADFEVIKHNQDGGLEVGKQLPNDLPQKKVTFVFLEEQPDGSFKVKGVRGNENGQNEDQPPAAEVDSLIKQIQEGDLKLPAPSNLSPQQSTASQRPTSLPPSTQQYIPQSTLNSLTSTSKPRNIIKVSSNLNFQQRPDMEFFSSVTLPPYSADSTQNSVSWVNNNANKQTTSPAIANSPYSVEAHPSRQKSQTSAFPQPAPSPVTPTQHQHQVYQVTPNPNIPQFSPTPNSISTNFSPNKYSPSSIPQYTTSAPKKQFKSNEPFLPTNPTFLNPSQNFPSFFQLGKNEQPVPGIIYANPNDAPSKPSPSPNSPLSYENKQTEYQQNEEAPSQKFPTRVAAPENKLRDSDKLAPLDEDGSVDYQTKVEAPVSLAQVLKNEGLYAMARFIRESGLNNILNDTGPYTVFAPTDKAFRALLVQLGGPEKAEEKFKENPRLLSGLLLHHVIPGAFELSSLQDEMTGVSLAGTQLRVNTYNTQDAEWNELQVVTINGARITRDKHDIPIPQGIAHAVDRVMFPLPVGNILQTLRSDRERRFTKFLRAIQSSGLTETFTGNKVYTVFAPTDRAFSVVDPDDLEGLMNDRDMSRALVLRHTTPGTLYSAGMRFYQQRDSMEKGSAITLHKTNGQVKANNANVVTHNIPATNGVIHAIDGLL